MPAKPFLEVHPERLAQGYRGAVDRIPWESTLNCSGQRDTEIHECVAQLRFQQMQRQHSYKYHRYLFAAAGVQTANDLRALYTNNFNPLKASDGFTELLEAINSGKAEKFAFHHLDCILFAPLARWDGRRKLLDHYGWGVLQHIPYRKLKSKMIYLYKKVWKDPVVHTIGEIPPQEAILVDCTSLFDVGGTFGGSEEAIALRQSMEACLCPEGGGADPVERIPFVPTRGQQLKSRQAMARRKEFEKKQRGIKPYSYRGLLVFNYFDGDNPKKDAMLGSRARSLFDDIGKLERLLGVILRCFGDCQLLDESTLALKHYIMTALFTKVDHRQPAHLDYAIKTLGGGRNARRRRADGAYEGPFPWAADIPLSEGGMYLSLWHGYKASLRGEGGVPVENWSMRLHVPFGWILLWRGDLVHAGGFQNDLGNGALRVHRYIYMKQGDIDLDYGRERKTSTDLDDGLKTYDVCLHKEEADGFVGSIRP